MSSVGSTAVPRAGKDKTPSCPEIPLATLSYLSSARLDPHLIDEVSSIFPPRESVRHRKNPLSRTKTPDFGKGRVLKLQVPLRFVVCTVPFCFTFCCFLQKKNIIRTAFFWHFPFLLVIYIKHNNLHTFSHLLIKLLLWSINTFKETHSQTKNPLKSNQNFMPMAKSASQCSQSVRKAVLQPFHIFFFPPTRTTVVVSSASP